MLRCSIVAVLLVSVLGQGWAAEKLMMRSREYKKEIVYYPDGWTPKFKQHDKSDGLGRDESFVHNIEDSYAYVKRGKGGHIVRDWAYASIYDLGMYPNGKANSLPTGEILPNIMQNTPFCSPKRSYDCMVSLKPLTINKTEMFFYEVRSSEEREVKRLDVVFRKAGHPYWFTFKSHKKDFDAYWPSFRAMLNMFKRKK